MKIAPSILSADFSQLKKEIQEVENGGADYIHIDVMDGHFVPNITIGPLIVKAVRPHTSLPLDVHLMIEKPELYIDEFVSAGADIITVHIEACPHIHRTIQQIKGHGIKAGVVLNPGTPLSSIQHILEDIDMVLIMTVNPGFGGQQFIEGMIEKIRELRNTINARGLDIEIEVDGGINEDTIQSCLHAGADVFVAGSAVYNHQDRKAAITRLKQAVK